MPSVSPVGSLLWTAGAFLLRLVLAKIRTRFFGAPYTIFQKREVKPENFVDKVDVGQHTISPNNIDGAVLETAPENK